MATVYPTESYRVSLGPQVREKMDVPDDVAEKLESAGLVTSHPARAVVAKLKEEAPVVEAETQAKSHEGDVKAVQAKDALEAGTESAKPAGTGRTTAVPTHKIDTADRQGRTVRTTTATPKTTRR